MVDRIEAALAADSRAALRDALGVPRPELGPGSAIRLTARLRELDPAARPLRIAVLRSYSTELLRPWLELEGRLSGWAPVVQEAPYGVLRVGDEGTLHDPDLVIVFARPEDLSPALAAPASQLSTPELTHRVDDAIDGLSGILSGVRGASDAPVLFTLLPRFGPPELGVYEGTAAEPAAALEAALARAVAEHLREDQNDALLVDLNLWLQDVGRARGFDARLWHSSRVPFSSEGSHHLARHLFAAATALLEQPAKCLVLDADDTLWGGILGEEGVDGVALGPEHPGSCYVDFQRRLLDFRGRGILLALASRNEPSDVLALLRGHPHQVLREDAFAAIEIGWEPKVESLRRIAATLSIGLDGLVFVDDSPHEIHAVRSALPEVEAVQVPSDPVSIPVCLDELHRLEIARLTDEDRRRPQLYAEQKQRRSLAAAAVSADDYLRSLQIVMTVSEDDPATVPRVAQLCGKTNQFNLTTRRHRESEIERFVEADDAVVLAFSLADVLGDSGLVGVSIIDAIAEGEGDVDTFLMSCRVIGRRAETAFLGAVIDSCERRGVRRLRAYYEPTARNGVVADFWLRHGFAQIAPGRYERDLAVAPPIELPPIEILTAVA